ncbi:hypothetical protein FPSM_01188 [Flavobacterium psychrophilum]|nr:hypothetical protein FPSM_01188 [Flavobacterium psychrophilum]
MVFLFIFVFKLQNNNENKETIAFRIYAKWYNLL